jgi:hypothetical protein
VTGANDPGFRGGVALNFDYTASGIHGDAYAADVLATPDGKILIGGYEYAGFSFGDAALIRLTADGSFDSSFGNLNLGLPGRMGYGHTLFGSNRDNRLDSMALSADGKRVVFGGDAYASNDSSSVMQVRLYAQDLLEDGFAKAQVRVHFSRAKLHWLSDHLRSSRKVESDPCFAASRF